MEGVRMQKKVISCVICALMIAAILVIEVPKDVRAQVTEEWIATYDGSANGLDIAYDIAIDQNGNIFVTGSSMSIPTGLDVVTLAYDPKGNLLWKAQYDGPGNGSDGALAIATDADSNVYVTGSSDNIDGLLDYVTIAYDSSGNELWVARYDSPIKSSDRAFAICVDSSSNVYVTGESHVSGPNDDYATVKYDSMGNEIWARLYGSSKRDVGEAIAVDAQGNVYVTGTGGTVAYDSNGNLLWEESGTGNALAIGSFGNIFVTGSGIVAYDSQGNALWTDTGFIGRDIISDSYGNVYATGTNNDFGTGEDYYTVAYDSLGHELWNARYDGPANSVDWPWAIALGSLGNVYVGGDSVGIDTGRDFCTVAYDPNGNEMWVARSNGPMNWHDTIRAIAVDSLDNIYVTGEYQYITTYADYIIIKYSQRSNIVATINIDPDTLNLKSKGRWITCYITLNKPYDVNDMDISTVLLEDTIPAEWGDIQGDTLMVKFDRSDVEDMLSPGTYNLKVTGELTDGTEFEGDSDEIRVIEPPGNK
jgi:hypothetical protein